LVVPQPTLEYYEDVIDTTFRGDTDLARDYARLFMAPGMNHCRGGAGPNTWDKLEPLVDWVEHDRAPEFLRATHSTDGVVDNERLICAHPAQSVYNGPAAGVQNARNWRFENFGCQLEP